MLKITLSALSIIFSAQPALAQLAESTESLQNASNIPYADVRPREESMTIACGRRSPLPSSSPMRVILEDSGTSRYATIICNQGSPQIVKSIQFESNQEAGAKRCSSPSEDNGSWSSAEHGCIGARRR
jgi:hypothetical protein